MIRTWSLLLRNARRQGYMISGRVDPQQLSESPFLMHPVENGTVGLYRTPVCVLDFASLCALQSNVECRSCPHIVCRCAVLLTCPDRIPDAVR